jgi:hypothetical protein
LPLGGTGESHKNNKDDEFLASFSSDEDDLQGKSEIKKVNQDKMNLSKKIEILNVNHKKN